MRSPEFAPVHRSGECDDCHDSPVELYGFDEDEPGDWEYCRGCAERISRKRIRSNKLIRETL